MHYAGLVPLEALVSFVPFIEPRVSVCRGASFGWYKVPTRETIRLVIYQGVFKPRIPLKPIGTEAGRFRVEFRFWVTNTNRLSRTIVATCGYIWRNPVESEKNELNIVVTFDSRSSI